MSLLDALPDVIGAVFASLFDDATLTQAAAITADGQGGTRVASTVLTPCKARFAAVEDMRRTAGVARRERSILVLASTLGGVVPAMGDTLTIDDAAWVVIEVATDPVAAVWTLQARASSENKP